ncbi:MAG TPA: haloacid dehalogenase-like hydrolase [Gemmatimonadales bacterium]|nr:haloacid dehalogenase-like hydrolase [Gemmatimonadales bacterium]
MKRKLVLFDIDGTLLLTQGAGRRALTAAMAHLVGDLEVFRRVRFDGKTDPQIVAEILTLAGVPEPALDQRIEVLCKSYVALLERELRPGTPPVRVLPGVGPLLERLEAEAGVVLGLLTGNLSAGAALKLRAAGLDPSRFTVGAFGSDAAERPRLPAIAARRARPFFGREPRGEEIVIVGDTPADVTCGREVGARAVAVATGSYALVELTAAGAHAAFEDLAATEAVVQAILA